MIPSDDTKILAFNQYQKSNKITFIIYGDLKSLIKKVNGCKNNPEKSSTRKISEHIPCGYSISTIWTLDGVENEHNVYRCKDWIKKFCQFLSEHAIKITKNENDSINK